jgi:hypothetical protein
MRSNNIPELLKKYGDKITFMGGVNNADIDHVGWTHEEVTRAAHHVLADGARTGFIPSLTGGGPGSTYPGVYDTLTEELAKINMELFGCC